MDREKCKCGKLLIPAYGPSTSKILLIGEFPGMDEIMKGIPFIGRTGDILRAECAKAGLDISRCRLTNLWQHDKDEKGCDITIHLRAMAKELKGKKFALLMGSDLTQEIWGQGVMELSGLEVKSELFPKTRLFVSPNPAIVMHGPVGELRLALERFTEAVNDAKI